MSCARQGGLSLYDPFVRFRRPCFPVEKIPSDHVSRIAPDKRPSIKVRGQRSVDCLSHLTLQSANRISGPSLSGPPKRRSEKLIGRPRRSVAPKLSPSVP